MKPSKIFFTMSHHHTYTSIDRILNELQSRNVDVCRDEVHNNVCEGLNGELGDRIAYLLDLPTPDGFMMPLRVYQPRQKAAWQYGTSEFIGVTKNKSTDKWEAKISIKRKLFYLGLYEVEKDAARAYNHAARHLGRRLNAIQGEKFDPKSPLVFTPKIEKILAYYDFVNSSEVSV